MCSIAIRSQCRRAHKRATRTRVWAKPRLRRVRTPSRSNRRALRSPYPPADVRFIRVSGVYQGAVRIGTLRNRGDLGLGTKLPRRATDFLRVSLHSATTLRAGPIDQDSQQVHLDVVELPIPTIGELAEKMPWWHCGPMPMGRTSVKVDAPLLPSYRNQIHADAGQQAVATTRLAFAFHFLDACATESRSKRPASRRCRTASLPACR